MKYVLGIDQSTQGTKAILVDENGAVVGRADRMHRQLISEKGWISHDPEEIYHNVLRTAKEVIEKTEIDRAQIVALGISNQRETSILWDRSGRPRNDAVVWQCARAKEISDDLRPYDQRIREITGLTLSPYFPAAKMAWLLRHSGEIGNRERLCLGTVDSWLIYRLTGGTSFRTDYSNASRTQLFDIHRLRWSEEICGLFEVPMEFLPQVCDSNSDFGYTDLEGYLPHAIPIHGVLGDSHAALFGQGCHDAGMIKTTYGTGSSIMMNTGSKCVMSRHGLVTSLAWGMDGKVTYVLEGNINYTGAVITWLQESVRLIADPAETEQAAMAANPEDTAVLVPAFSGLSAPYWEDEAKAVLCGMSRTTGRNEIIRAALDSIAFQIDAVLDAMAKDSGIRIEELRVDGGPTKNRYLMQQQSNLSDTVVAELSALGAAYMAGIAVGLCQTERLFKGKKRVCFFSVWTGQERTAAKHRWREAVMLAIRPHSE